MHQYKTTIPLNTQKYLTSNLCIMKILFLFRTINKLINVLFYRFKMSNLHVGLPFPGWAVDHSSNLAHDIGALYLNDQYSDITIKVNGHIFHGHKVILAARSQYFR